MKMIIKFCLSTIIGLACFIVQPNRVLAQPGGEVTMQEFYDELEPYGQWIDDPQYGYVWRPDAGNDFRPYQTNGHWTMTEYGNMWVSNYDWGWAPFHYGRWTLNDRYGWLWIPGTEWGPAWVDWRQGDGYYGWAPLGPGINININLGRRWYAPDPWWCFVPQRYILSPKFYGYRVPAARNVTIIRNTTIIQNNYVRNNVRYVSGPRVDDIRQVTNQRVNVYNVGANNRPGATRIANNTVNVYRPQIARVNNSNGTRPAPGRVVRSGESRVNTPNNRNNNGSENIARSRGDRESSVRPGSNAGVDNRTSSGVLNRSSNTNSRNRPERVMNADRSQDVYNGQQVARNQQMQQRNQQMQAAQEQRGRQMRDQQGQMERQQRGQQQQMQRQQRSQERQMQRPERSQQQDRPTRVERSRRG